MDDNARSLFFAFTTYEGDRERFATWYDDTHIPQVLNAPGAVSAQRFEIAETKPLPGVKSLEWGHLALYEIDGDPQAFRDGLVAQIESGEMTIPEFVDMPLKLMLLKPVSPAFHGDRYDADDDLATRGLFFAFSTHHGDYDTFAKWYDDEHVPQVMSAPGMYRAQRFMDSGVAPLPGADDPGMYHLALYELLGDMGPFREGVKQMLMSGEMVLPDFMIPPFETIFMSAVSPRFTRETVAA